MVATEINEADVARKRANELLGGYRATQALQQQDVFLEGIKYWRARAEIAVKSRMPDQVALGQHWLSIFDLFDAEVK